MKCDRCGDSNIRGEFERIRFCDGNWNGEKERHLCKKCNREFRIKFREFVEVLK